jgi:hypothetical protein
MIPDSGIRLIRPGLQVILIPGYTVYTILQVSGLFTGNIRFRIDQRIGIRRVPARRHESCNLGGSPASGGVTKTAIVQPPARLRLQSGVNKYDCNRDFKLQPRPAIKTAIAPPLLRLQSRFSNLILIWL